MLSFHCFGRGSNGKTGLVRDEHCPSPPLRRSHQSQHLHGDSYACLCYTHGAVYSATSICEPYAKLTMRHISSYREISLVDTNSLHMDEGEGRRRASKRRAPAVPRVLSVVRRVKPFLVRNTLLCDILSADTRFNPIVGCLYRRTHTLLGRVVIIAHCFLPR